MWMMCRLQGGRERHLDRAWLEGKEPPGRGGRGEAEGLRQPEGAVQSRQSGLAGTGEQREPLQASQQGKRQ